MHATSIKSCTIFPPSNTQIGGKVDITFMATQLNEMDAS